MPTIITHPAIPLAVGIALGQKVITMRLLLAGVVGAILPDLDVIAFQLGIPYGSDLGHRGFSHSLLFAAVYAGIGACFARGLQVRPAMAFLFLFAATASHGILDAFTNGGSGIALLWPFTSARYFAPVQPIEVSPIGISRFLSERGLDVLRSELLWVWLPCALLAVIIFIYRRYRERRGVG
jgi:inner membrane protein